MILELRKRAQRAHNNDRLFLGIVYGAAGVFVLLIAALLVQLTAARGNRFGPLGSRFFGRASGTPSPDSSARYR